MPGSDEGAAGREARRARVVVAEDDARMLEVIAFEFRDDGHEVVEVGGHVVLVPFDGITPT